MENNYPVFVTQEFDGKEIKNIYHIPISPEIYFKLELIRRKFNFKTINEVLKYLLEKHKSSESQHNDTLITSLKKLSPITRKKLEEFIDKYGVDALIKLLEDK